MFYHNFKYSLKVFFRNKMLLFWTFIFPILLGVFFNMAFSDIEKNEKLDTIDIAIIESDNFSNNNIYKEAFTGLEDNKILNITYTNKEKAEHLLKDKKITGYLTIHDDIKITVNNNGINETILRYITDEISSNEKIINTLSKKEIEENFKSGNYNLDYEKIIININNLIKESNPKLNDISNHNLSYTMIEYYTLIALSCLYGGILSMFIVNYKLANMCPLGKRTSISGVNKTKILLSSLLASYIVQLMGVTLLLLFTILFLHVDYGTLLPQIIILVLVGSLAGLSLGVLVATLVKSNENTKTGILIAVTMFCCFLSGMMGITMKYIVDKNVPFLNKINPANMITDGFYSLYYYPTLDRYTFNIISLLIFSSIMIIISIYELRRQQYDSI